MAELTHATVITMRRNLDQINAFAAGTPTNVVKPQVFVVSNQERRDA